MVLPHLATLPEAASPAHWYQLMAARRRGERHPHTAALPETASPAHWYQLMAAPWRETPSHRSARPTEPGLTPAMPRQREFGTSCPNTTPCHSTQATPLAVAVDAPRVRCQRPGHNSEFCITCFDCPRAEVAATWRARRRASRGPRTGRCPARHTLPGCTTYVPAASVGRACR